MRTLTIQELDDDPGLYDQIADVLRDGGLACFPNGRQYGIAAPLMSEDSVIRLVQAKRRAKRAPSLVLIPDRGTLGSVVCDVPDAALSLMDTFWPGPLTILLRPSEDLPHKVKKTLAAKKQDRVGVRISDSPVASRIVAAFGGPLLLTSANRASKVGSLSVAQIRKNFAHTVDIIVDAGDLPADPPSTIVDPESADKPIRREGVIPADQITPLL
jgi:L-threonylcarbamoyladenylate synthase